MFKHQVMGTTNMKGRFCVVLVLFVHCIGMATASASNALKVPDMQVISGVAKPLRPPKIVLRPEDYLSTSYYQNSCPDLEGIIQLKLQALIKRDNTLAASIIRLHFHDCIVRGCDASVLLNHAGSERAAEVSKTLRGFQVIDEIKAEVEKRCPKIVSCADILTAAARDATLMVGGPFWEVPFGRKDGLVSLAKEANMVPHGNENITGLIKLFETKGLNILDMVILSGAHTIGRSSCSAIQQRVFNFNNTGKPDPSINIKYLSYLSKKCKLATNYVHLDATTPRTFDEVYYTNLERRMGLLSSDQLLFSDQRTAPLVDAMATQSQLFINQFAVSMVKLGNLQLLTGKNQGQVRLNCNYVNKGSSA